MNGRERICSVLNGEWPDKRPVMLHNFMMVAREAGISMKTYREDPEKAAAAHIEAVEKYDPDGILIDMDTATLAGAAGVPVDFPEDEPARTCGPLLHSLDDMGNLGGIDISSDKRVGIWLETCTIVKEHFGGEKYVRGNCDQAPFSLAGMVRGSENWMLDLITQPEKAHRLLEYCTGLTIQFIRLMAQTGVDMVSNGDSLSGPELISPELYKSFAFPYEKEVAGAAHELGLPYVLHICGNTDRIVEDMVKTGADGLELDYMTNITWIKHCLAGRTVFLGNLDPVSVLEQGSPAQVQEKVLELLNLFEDEPGFILNSGCAIPPDTPEENIKTMIRSIRSF